MTKPWKYHRLCGHTSIAARAFSLLTLSGMTCRGIREMKSGASAALRIALCSARSDAVNAQAEGQLIQPASATIGYGSNSDRFRVVLAPNYSKELGLGLRGAAAAYLTDAVALGLIVEYGGNKRG